MKNKKNNKWVFWFFVTFKCFHYVPSSNYMWNSDLYQIRGLVLYIYVTKITETRIGFKKDKVTGRHWHKS